MNKETKDLIVSYIIESLNPVYGISEKCYEILQQILKTDRELAMELHDTNTNLFCKNHTYYIEPDPSDLGSIYKEREKKIDAAMEESLLIRRELFLEKIQSENSDFKAKLKEYENFLQDALLKDEKPGND